MRVHRHADAASFLARAEAWLDRAEMEHNLILSKAASFAHSTTPDDVYFATVEDGDEVLACAFRTPPRKAVITKVDQQGAELLVTDLIGVYGTLPAVLGPEGTRFGAWQDSS